LTEDSFAKIGPMFTKTQGEGEWTCSHGFGKQIFVLNQATLLERRKCI